MNAVTNHLMVVRQALAAEKERARRIVRVQETGFLPAALEVVERPVSPTARVTVWVLLAGLLVLLLWLTFGRIDIVASAQGSIVPSGNVKLVQPAQAGIVREILVSDGQRVKKGEPLVLLDPTASEADLQQANSALQSAELDVARSRAVLGALNGGAFAFVPPAGVPLDVAETHRQLARAQLTQLQSANAAQSAGSRAAASGAAEARAQAAKLQETIPLVEEQLAANEKLLEKGFVSKLRVIEMRRQLLAMRRDRDIALQTAAGAGAQMASTSSGAAASGAQMRADLLANLARAEVQVTQLRGELAKSRQRADLHHITAPVDGTVAQLSIHTESGIVEAGKPLMAIVPDDGQLIAQVKIANKDVGFVQIGQPVSVKLDAFPFTRYGTIEGKLIGISGDAVLDQQLGPVYIARVALSRTTVDRGDRQARVLPGMVATADIKTGRRSLLSYLVSPIDQARREAVRER